MQLQPMTRVGEEIRHPSLEALIRFSRDEFDFIWRANHGEIALWIIVGLDMKLIGAE